jgi:hypothetical protein
MTRTIRTPTSETAALTADWSELDARTIARLELRLLWRRADGAVAVSLHDPLGERRVSRTVPPELAADAFRHPFPYLARSTAGPLRAADLEPARQRPEAACIDVDELWLCDLVDETLAQFSELLSGRGAERGGRRDDGI